MGAEAIGIPYIYSFLAVLNLALFEAGVVPSYTPWLLHSAVEWSEKELTRRDEGKTADAEAVTVTATAETATTQSTPQSHSPNHSPIHSPLSKPTLLANVHPYHSKLLIEALCKQLKIVLNILACDSKGDNRCLLDVYGELCSDTPVLSLAWVTDQADFFQRLRRGQGAHEDVDWLQGPQRRRQPHHRQQQQQQQQQRQQSTHPNAAKRNLRRVNPILESFPMEASQERWILVRDMDKFVGTYPCRFNCGWVLRDEYDRLQHELHRCTEVVTPASDEEFTPDKVCRLKYAAKIVQPDTTLAEQLEAAGYQMESPLQLYGQALATFDIESEQIPFPSPPKVEGGLSQLVGGRCLRGGAEECPLTGTAIDVLSCSEESGQEESGEETVVEREGGKRDGVRERKTATAWERGGGVREQWGGEGGVGKEGDGEGGTRPPIHSLGTKRTRHYFYHSLFCLGFAFSLHPSEGMESSVDFVDRYLDPFSFVSAWVGELIRCAMAKRNYQQQQLGPLISVLTRDWIAAEQESGGGGYHAKILRSLLKKIVASTGALTIGSWFGSSFDLPILINAGLLAALRNIFPTVKVLKKGSSYLSITASGSVTSDESTSTGGISLRFIDFYLFHSPTSLSVFLDSHKQSDEGGEAGREPGDLTSSTKGLVPYYQLRKAITRSGQSSGVQWSCEDFIDLPTGVSESLDVLVSLVSRLSLSLSLLAGRLGFCR